MSNPILRGALLALMLASPLAHAGDPRLSGLPPLPKGAVVVTNPLDGNCGANNQLDEPVEIKTKNDADCQKWLAAVSEAYKQWPSEKSRAVKAINSMPEASASSGSRLYAVAQCYELPNVPENCGVTHSTGPSGQPFGSLKACQTFIVKYLNAQVPQGPRFYLNGNTTWYECVSRPDDRWQVP